MTITLNPVGAVDYKENLNCRYMSEPFQVGAKTVTIEFGAHFKGGLFPKIYETDEQGNTTGNKGRMIAAGYLESYEYGYKVIAENLPEFSRYGMIEAIAAIYPEIEVDVYLDFIDR